MRKVFNFSGGRTSAYMVIHYAKPGDLVIFCDTGREHPGTYKFIEDFERNENIQIIKLQYPGGFDKLIEKRKAVPNKVQRFCTQELKIKTCRRYLRSIGWFEYENYIGFRADEPNRVRKRKQFWKKVYDKFPLYDDGITEDIINNYWESKNYGLQIPKILGNCTLCFLKGKSAIMAILSVYPEIADPWIEDEKKTGHTYLNGISIESIKNMAQNNLFKQYHDSLKDMIPAFNCECTT